MRAASRTAVAALDESFFRARFDGLTPAEKKYLRAVAELGPGPHRSGDIALCLKRDVTSLGPTRNQLIAKGMIWSPNHGARHSPCRFSINSCAESFRAPIGGVERQAVETSPVRSDDRIPFVVTSRVGSVSRLTAAQSDWA